MRQQFGMNQKMQQRMVMTPMLQQAMKILQLSTLELKEWVEKEMLENPVLEEENEEIPATAAEKSSPTDALSTPPGEQENPDTDALMELARQRHQTELVEHMKEGDRFENKTWELYDESAEYGES